MNQQQHNQPQAQVVFVTENQNQNQNQQSQQQQQYQNQQHPQYQQQPTQVIYAQPTVGQGSPLLPGQTGIHGFEFSNVGEWRGNTCDCCSIACCPATMMAWCCPCFPLGQLANKFGVMEHWVVVTIILGGMIIAAIVATTTGIPLQGLIGLFVFIMVFVIRGKARAKLNIPGDCCEDCCCSFFCTCCTLAQMSRTVYNYREGDQATCAPEGEPLWWETQMQAQAQMQAQVGANQNPMFVSVAGVQPGYQPPGQPQYQQGTATVVTAIHVTEGGDPSLHKPQEPPQPEV